MVSPHRVHALPGGARLVVESMPERHSTSVVLMFAGGSRLEDERLAGVSHFIEHLYFKGTQRRPSSKEIADAIEGVGGFINASTDKELTAYWARVPSEHMALGLDVLFDVVTNSKLDPADVERERMVILEELRMYQDQPQDYVQNLFEELIWPGHALGRDIAGTEESVSRLTRDDILEYADARYRLPNLVVGAAGSLEETETLGMVATALSLPGDLDGALSASPPPALDGPRVLVRRRGTEQAHICLGTRALSYLHPDRYALDLLNTVLGEGMSSRLFLNIRERLGLAYDVHSFTQKHRDTGYLGVYIGVDPSKAADAVNAAMAELRALGESEVFPEELTRAKEFTKGRLRLELETTNGVAFWLTYQELLLGEIKSIDEEVALVGWCDGSGCEAGRSRGAWRSDADGRDRPVHARQRVPARDRRLALGGSLQGNRPDDDRTSFEHRHLCVDVAEVIERPDAKPSFAVDPVAGDGTEKARVLRFVSVVAHHEVLVGRDEGTIAEAPWLRIGLQSPGLGQVGLVEPMAVDVHDTVANQQPFARQGDDPLDEVGGVVRRRPEDDDVAALRGVQPIVDLVRDQVVVVVQGREHGEAFDMHRLNRKADSEVEDDGENDDLSNLTQEGRGRGAFIWGGASRVFLLGRHCV